MRLTDEVLARHVYVLGGTGVGKSRALESWALQLIRAGQGVGVIDPHGDLYHNLLARLATTDRRVAERLVLFDPLDPAYTVGFNPLELKAGEVPERRAQFLAGVVTKLFRLDPLVTARMQRLMFHAFWLLIQVKLTLLEFVPLLTNLTFREHLLTSLAETAPLRLYWEREFPENERLVTEWTQSSLNKVGELVTDPDILLLLGQQRSTVDFRQVLDEGRVLLVHVPKGLLGERNSHLLGAFVLAQLQLAALSRADDPYNKRRRFTLFVDEFQNYTSDDIHHILAESRKYQLALVMAHQFYDQLREVPQLQAAVLNTVGNLICFRIGAGDARQFVRDLFTPPVDEIKDIRRRRVPTGVNWWPFVIEEEAVWRPLQEIWELETRRLTLLQTREFWYKQRGPYPAHLLRTPEMPDVARSARLDAAIEVLRMTSATIYGRPKQAVQAEIARRHAGILRRSAPVPALEEVLVRQDTIPNFETVSPDVWNDPAE